MILTDGTVIRCRYALGTAVQPGTIVVHAANVEDAHRQLILHVSEQPGYKGQPINILSTESVCQVSPPSPSEDGPERVSGLREGVVVEEGGATRKGKVGDDGTAS